MGGGGRVPTPGRERGEGRRWGREGEKKTNTLELTEAVGVFLKRLDHRHGGAAAGLRHPAVDWGFRRDAAAGFKL